MASGFGAESVDGVSERPDGVELGVGGLKKEKPVNGVGFETGGVGFEGSDKELDGVPTGTGEGCDGGRIPKKLGDETTGFGGGGGGEEREGEDITVEDVTG